MAGNGSRGGSSRSSGGASVKLNAGQRAQMAFLRSRDGNDGTRLEAVRRDANAMRTRLPKAMRDGLGVNTVGGALERLQQRSDSYARSRTGLSRSEQDRFIRVLDASGRGGRGGFSGVRLRVDERGNRNLEMTPMARRQASLAETAGSRRRR